MAFSLFNRVAVLAPMICVALAASSEDAKPVVGPSFAQGSVKFQSVGVWSKEEGDQFSELTDQFDAQQTIADDQPTSNGRNLAQIDTKFVGAKLPSEEVDLFAQLTDEFDDHHQTRANDQVTSHGSNLAQIASKFVGAKWSAEIMGQSLSDFASLDDAFDESMWQDSRDAGAINWETEPEEFSVRVRAILTNPYLYLTISLILFGGLLATSPSSSPPAPETAQQQQTNRPVAQRSQSSDINGSDAPPQLPTHAQKAAIASDTAIPKLSLPSEFTTELPDSIDAISPEAVHKSLMEAANACRAGEPGSYAEFCRVLSESAQS